MSKIWLPGGGGGGDGSDDCTIILSDVPKGLKAITADSDDEAKEGNLDTVTSAADSHVLADETYMKYNTTTKHWEKRVGTEPNRGAWNERIGINGKVTIPAGYHNGGGYVDQAVTNCGSWVGRIGVNGKVLIPEGYHNGQGYVDQNINNRGGWTSSLGINGKAIIPEGYHNGQGYVNQNLPVQGGSTTVPGTSNKTIVAANRYVNGNIIVSGDSKLVAGNIKKGVTIFGVTGTHSGYVVEPTDLYSRGNNVNGWHITAGDSSKFQFGSAQITMNNPAVHIDASKGFSTIGFKYLCFEMNITRGGRIELYYIDGATVLGKLDTSSTGAVTLKIDISAAQYPNLAALRIYNFVGALFRIYLSN